MNSNFSSSVVSSAGITSSGESPPRRSHSSSQKNQLSSASSLVRSRRPGLRAVVSSSTSRRTSWPWARSCRAISKATKPPKDQPPIRYGPSGCTSRMRAT